MKKTVLITGASRGIGAQTARKFYENGYNVVINYNNSEKEAIKLSNELAGSIAIKCDVSSQEQVKAMIESVISKFGRIDVLVNNAAIAVSNLLTDITEKEWDDLFSVNVKGMFLASKYAVKDMLKYHNGKIINVSSMWGISGASCECAYSATKGAVISFTKALAKELGPSGINVNCVAPGFIDTDMNNNISREDADAFCENTPLMRMGNSEEIANAIYFLASEDASFITGQILSVDGGAII